MSDPAACRDVEDLLARCWFPRAGERVDCAVSGGADSLALLVLATAAGCRVHVHHVDHGLRVGSDADGEVVAAAAARFGAGFSTVLATVAPGPNLEARARRARYRALPPGVATGHTADDQAETMMLALLRGSAWEGMAGMTPGPRRPLLALRRSETADLCARFGLEPVHDETNVDPRFRRNRVRAELLPLATDIAGRDLVPVLVRQAELFRQGGEQLGVLADAIDPMDAAQLGAAPVVLARLAVRNWLWRSRDLEHPPDLATVDRVLSVARCRGRATDVGGGWRVERSGMRLRLRDPRARG